MDDDNNELRGKGTPVVRNEMRAKGLSELLEGIYGVRFQAVEPPHRHWS